MKRILSLTLVIIMIFSSCMVISGIWTAQAASATDAEGFASIYREGFEASAVPFGGKTNITFNSLSDTMETQAVTISKKGASSVYAYVWDSLDTARPYMNRINITYLGLE